MAAATIRKEFPGFFAIVIVSIFVYAEMASAWDNICVPGDIYMDSYTDVVEPVCPTCTAWCKSECSKLQLSMVNDTDKCKIQSSILRCRCCCETPPPLFSPQKPPPPPSADNFVGPEPYKTDICLSNQKSENFGHPDGNDCIQKPLCEQTCKDKGLTKARSECVAAGSLTTLTWYEQCCCGTPPTPPTNVCEDCSFLQRAQCSLPFSSCNCCCKSILSCNSIPPLQ